MAGVSFSPIPGTVSTINPPANTEISESVPAGRVWSLSTIALTLVADATVANRDITVIIEDAAGNEIYRQTVVGSITASQTGKIFISKWGGSKPADAAPTFYLSLPNEIDIPAGYVIKTVTTGLQAGDDYGAPVIHVRDFSIPTT